MNEPIENGRRAMVEGAIAQNDARLAQMQTATLIGPDGTPQRVMVDPNVLMQLKLGVLVEHLLGDMDQEGRLEFETALINVMDQFLDRAEAMLAEQKSRSGLVVPGAGVDMSALAKRMGNGSRP